MQILWNINWTLCLSSFVVVIPDINATEVLNSLPALKQIHDGLGLFLNTMQMGILAE